MNKILLPLLFAGLMVTTNSFAQNPPPATTDTPATPAAPAPAPAETPASKGHHMHHPEIHKAMRKLRGAKMDLEKAAHDYGGHKAKAMAAIDEALTELHAALDYEK